MGGAYTAVRGEVVMVPRLGGDHTPVASGAQLETEPEPGLGTHCLQTVITNTGDRGRWSSAVCDSLNIICEGPRSLSILSTSKFPASVPVSSVGQSADSPVVPS